MAFGDFTVARTSVKYVLNASGVLASVAANTPAFGFNADGTYRGLLVEPGATNLFTYSQDFNNAAWTKTATITSNSDVAPDGTTTADTFTDGTGAFLDFRQAVTIVTATTYTVSVFIEKTVGALTHYPGIGVSLGGGTELGYAIFNTTTGATATDGVVGLTVSSRSFEYPDYWRFEFTFLGTETSALFLFYPALSSNGTTINSAATGSNVFWGAQLETGSVATSYVPTVASTATRTADSVSLTGASSLIGQTEGTIFVEHQPILSTGLVSRQVIGVSDNTFDTYTRLDYQAFGSPNRYRLVSTVRQGGSNLYQYTEGNAGGLTTGNVEKLAIAYKDADYATYRNGVAVVGTDTGTGTLTSIASSEIDLGQAQDNTRHINGWIRAVALYPTRLSNAQLAVLTTL
jgi:hypothetical protein